MKKSRMLKRSAKNIPLKLKVLSVTRVGGDRNDIVDDNDGDDDDASVTSSVASSSPRKRLNMSFALSSSPKSKESNPRVYVSGFTPDMTKTTCSAKTGRQKNTNNPIYDETIYLGGDKFNGENQLVLTVLNHSKLGNHKFLVRKTMFTS